MVPLRALVASTAMVILSAAPAWAVLPPHALDPTFGSGGVATFDIPGSSLDRANGIVLQPDGKIVTAGTTGDGRILLTRHLPNGTPDPDFGDAGVAMLGNFDPGFPAAFDVALAPDGKIVVVDWNFTVVRVLPDGTRDTSFGTDALAHAAVPGGNSPRSVAVAVQSDGKIVIGGTQLESAIFVDQFVLARLDVSGTLDPSFGDGGVVTTMLAGYGASTDDLFTLAVQPDDRIVAGGSSVGFQLGFAMAVVRYLSNGSLDPSFGDGGVTRGKPGIVEKLTVAGDGAIVAACRPGNDQTGFCAARWRADGTPDPTFGDGGVATIDLLSHTLEPASLTAVAAVQQPDGKVVAAARSDAGRALVRLMSSGALDPVFGVDGIAELADPPGETFDGLVLQPDGRIVALGGAGAVVLTRFAGGVCGDGTLDGGETCDDGNAVDGDGCDTNCTVTACGNGIAAGAETCDDGNTLDGDCCSSSCTVEASGTPCDDGDACTKGDTCDAGRCSGVPTSCDDGTSCTVDSCDPRSGLCVNDQDLYDEGSAECRDLFQRLDWLSETYSPLPHYAQGAAHFGAQVVIGGDELLVLARDETDPSAQLFDLASGAFLHTFNDPTPFDRAFGPIAAVGSDFLIAAESLLGDPRQPGEVDLYDGSTFALRRAFVDPTPETFGFGAAILGHAGKVLAFDEGDGVVYVFDAVTGALVATLQSPDERALQPVLVPLGGDVLVPTDHAVHRFDLATGAIVRTFDDPTPDEGRFGQTIVPVGADVLIGGHREGAVYLFDGDTGAIARVFTDPGGRGFGFGESVAVIGDAVVIGRGRERVHVMDLATGGLRRTLLDPLPSGDGCFGESIQPLARGGFIVNDPCWGASRDDTYGIFHLYDLATGELVGRVRNRYGEFDDRFAARATSGDFIVATRHGGRDQGGVHVYHLCRPEGGVSVACDDGNLRNGDGCDANCTATICGNGIATFGEECDDGNRDDADACTNECTIDPCGGPCEPCSRCDPQLRSCVATVREACRRPVEDGAANLLVSSVGRGRAARVVWKWRRGEATPLSAFGDPQAGDEYQLCLFDVPLASGTPHVFMSAPAIDEGCNGDGCWRRDAKHQRLTFSKRDAPEGIRRAVLQAGEAGKAAITVRTGDLTGESAENVLRDPILVQLQGSNGACFESRFAPSDMRLRGTRVRASGD